MVRGRGEAGGVAEIGEGVGVAVDDHRGLPVACSGLGDVGASPAGMRAASAGSAAALAPSAALVCAAALVEVAKVS